MGWLRSGNKLSLSDEELVLKYRKAGDKEAITVLYDRYIHLIYGVCLKYLADREKAQDSTMQVFEKLLELLKIHEVKSFRSWVYTLAKNHCLMQLRKKAETVNIDIHLMDSGEEMHPIDELNEERLQILENCIKQLNEQQKLCVKLFYLKNNNYDQIAGETGFEIKKVKSYLQNGRRNLKLCMEKNEGKA